MQMKAQIEIHEIELKVGDDYDYTNYPHEGIFRVKFKDGGTPIMMLISNHYCTNIGMWQDWAQFTQVKPESKVNTLSHNTVSEEFALRMLAIAKNDEPYKHTVVDG